MNSVFVLALLAVGSIMAHAMARWVKGNVAMVLYGVGTAVIFAVWSTYKVYTRYPGSVWWYVLLTAATASLSYWLRVAKRYPFPGSAPETADL